MDSSGGKEVMNVWRLRNKCQKGVSSKHAGREETECVIRECKAWTYMLPILEEKPGERAV